MTLEEYIAKRDALLAEKKEKEAELKKVQEKIDKLIFGNNDALSITKNGHYYKIVETEAYIRYVGPITDCTYDEEYDRVTIECDWEINVSEDNLYVDFNQTIYLSNNGEKLYQSIEEISKEKFLEVYDDTCKSFRHKME